MGEDPVNEDILGPISDKVGLSSILRNSRVFSVTERTGLFSVLAEGASQGEMVTYMMTETLSD